MASSFRVPRARSLGLVVALACVLSVAGTLPSASAAPPPNDDIANAIEITALKFAATVDAREATEASDDPACFGRNTHTFWYTFTPPRDMRLEARTSIGLHRGIAASAYVGAPGSLDQVACGVSDWASGNGARVGFLANGGETLHLMVGYAGRSMGGDVKFSLRRGRTPSNDDFDDATVIDSLPFHDHGDSFWATPAADDPEAPAGCFDVPETSIWYRYTATENTRFLFQLATSGGSTVLAFTGARGSLAPIGCSSEVGAGVPINLAAGETVHFLVSWGGPQDGFVSADPDRLPRDRNDRLGSATLVGRLPLNQSLDTSVATARPADPDCFGAVSTVWYSFTPRIDLRVDASTIGSRYDTVLAAFEPTSGGLSEIDCLNDNLAGDVIPLFEAGSGFPTERLRFLAQGGHTYYFMVGALTQPSILRFSVREQVPVHVAPEGTVSADGIATIHGTITCTHDLDGQGSGVASQELPTGRVLASQFFKSRACHDGTRGFFFQARPSRGEFRSGTLHLELVWFFSRPDRSNYRYTETRVITNVHLS